MKRIPVIDLFAGPGGLNYGFSSFRSKEVRFDVRLSVEKDDVAWRTLHLRAFLRQFDRIPEDYYRYIRGEDGIDRDLLKKNYPAQWVAAEAEAKRWTLGKEPFATVSDAIAKEVQGADQWVLLGGPPCQAYSLAGRARMKNHNKFPKDKRHTLYREYLKIVAVHQPSVFVMENVKGLLSSAHGTRKKGKKAGSMFEQILQDLRNPAAAISGDRDAVPYLPKPKQRLNYKLFSFVVRAPTPDLLKPGGFVIKSEDWGVPQTRHRVILLGVRSDISVIPQILGEIFKNKKTKIEDVIGRMPKLRSRLSEDDSSKAWLGAIEKILQKNSLSGIEDEAIKKKLKKKVKKLKADEGAGGQYIEWDRRPKKLSRWIWDTNLKGIIQHQTRSHMESDLRRYFFVACWAEEKKISPRLRHFPKVLLPDHKNAKKTGNGKNAEMEDQYEFADRFRAQVKGKPATTITSHISKDGHYYIHFDPTQCRSLTVREAARLQTFPDSYFFEGNRTQQYQQVGNAVPPLLASKLAKIVADVIRRATAKKA